MSLQQTLRISKDILKPWTKYSITFRFLFYILNKVLIFSAMFELMFELIILRQKLKARSEAESLYFLHCNFQSLRQCLQILNMLQIQMVRT